MKISVIDPGKRSIRIQIPTSLVLNRVGAHIVVKAARKNGACLTFEQVYALITALKEFKRTHADWKLVEVESADGEYVCITM